MATADESGDSSKAIPSRLDAHAKDHSLAIDELIYADALRVIDNQREELSRMRTRAVTFAALVGTASSFLITNSLKLEARSLGFYITTVGITVTFLIMLILLGMLLAGSYKFKFAIGPTVFAGWRRSRPGMTKAELLSALVAPDGPLEEADRHNRKGLNRAQRVYQSIFIFGSLTAIGGIVLAWFAA